MTQRGRGKLCPMKSAAISEHKALALLLDLASRNERTLAGVVEYLPAMTEQDQAPVWNLIEQWANESRDDVSKARLRDKIRRVFFASHGHGRGSESDVKRKAREICEKLEPADAVARHLWLFTGSWVDDYAEANDDSSDDRGSDYDERDRRVDELRKVSMNEIWTEFGFDGIRRLLSIGADSQTVGYYAAQCVSGVQDSIQFVKDCLACTTGPEEEINDCVRSLLWYLEANELLEAVSEIMSNADAQQATRVLRLAPFTREMWGLVEQQGELVGQPYWDQVNPRFPPPDFRRLDRSI